MSLESLSNLRRHRFKKPAAVWVLVGNAPKWYLDQPDTIFVRPGQDPREMDWRAVTGLHVDVFECGDFYKLWMATVDAIEAAKPASAGFVCKAGCAGMNWDHEVVLERAQAMLCHEPA